MDHKMMNKEKMLNQIKMHKWMEEKEAEKMAEKMGVKVTRIRWLPKDSPFSA